MNIVSGKPRAAEYDPDPDLRDSEQVSYEISFTRYFYKPKPMRTLEQILVETERPI